MQLSERQICLWRENKHWSLVMVTSAKGSAQSLRQEGMIVKVVEVDPICAMQACMDGYEVVSPYNGGINTGEISDIDKRLMNNIDLVVTCTGNVHVCDSNILEHGET
jgi:adenosylhomocysteinase